MIIADNIKREPMKYPEFSKRIKAARKAKRMTQFELAEAIGMDFIAYNRIDNGYELPDDETMSKINRVLFGE